uniref:Uncharacterized protein n=1 Tax=Plectus sambesii TaxID=2011161 RepID=A0A914V766_9BILA
MSLSGSLFDLVSRVSAVCGRTAISFGIGGGSTVARAVRAVSRGAARRIARSAERVSSYILYLLEHDNAAVFPLVLADVRRVVVSPALPSGCQSVTIVRLWYSVTSVSHPSTHFEFNLNFKA